ncbi:MAG: hypothetical protein KDB82_17005 [Planctomycetes bacterium]|nr:hypothetical protein [Planctomycetota bacterium]
MPDPDRLAELSSALDEFLRTRELEQGRELPPEAPTLEDRRAELNEKFWVIVRQLVSTALPEGPDEPLQLSDAGRALIDFGVFPHPLLDELRGKLDTGSRVEGVVLFHDSLNAVLDDALRRDVIAEFRRDIDALGRDIALWPDTHLAHIHYRNAKIKDVLGDTTRGQHVLRLLSEVDEKLEQYKRLEARESAGDLGADDRKAWGTIRHFVDARLKEVGETVGSFASTPDPGSSATAAEALAATEAVQSSVAHLIELHEKQRALEEQVLEQQAASRRVTRPELEKALNRELSAVAGLLRLAARYVHYSECAVPVDEAVEFIDADRAADAMQRMLRFDPRLIDNPLAARFGPPELLLAPGIGDGVFDASRNRWVVPQRCTRSAAESLAHAAVLYRLEIDSKEMKKALLASYRESIPANRNVRANLKLRTNLIRDYINWMTLETFGEEVLSRETREWFERHIAPNKNEPWQPPEYRGMNEYQLKAELKELDELVESADHEYRIGVLEWMLAREDEQAIRERVLPRLDRAITLDADFPAPVYSAAILRMHLKDFQKAIAGFRRFTELVPRSWWSRKAIELCAHCR